MLHSPAMSPSLRCEASSSTVIVDFGPMARWVRVLRAHMSWSAGMPSVVVAFVRCVYRFCVACRGFRFEPGAGRASEVSGQSDHGPAVDPCHREQGSGSAQRMEVLHLECPPLPVGSGYYTTLVDVGASFFIGIRHLYSDRMTVGHYPAFDFCHGRVAVAESFVGGDHRCFVWAPDIVGPCACQSSVGLVVGGDDVVLAVYLIGVVSFAHSAAFRDDYPSGSFDWTAKVGFHFRAHHVAVLVDRIYPAVVVEEVAGNPDVFPRPCYLFACEALEPFAVDVGKDIEASVVVAYARSPYALAVNLFSVLERKCRIVEVVP